MQTYQGYIESGRIIPIDMPAAPDGSRVVITASLESERDASPDRAELFGCMRGKGYVAKNLDFKALGREEIAELFGLEHTSPVIEK